MSPSLIPRPFALEQRAKFTDFECGGEPWESAIAEWIKGSGVERSMERGTRVWTYELADGTLVGFGSLGLTTWRWPQGELPSAEQVSIIPALAIRAEFQGQPTTAPKSERYSSQLLLHLFTEAYLQNTNYLVLEVHERNLRAIRVYESYGFVASSTPVEKKFSGATHVYRRLFLRQR